MSDKRPLYPVRKIALGVMSLLKTHLPLINKQSLPHIGLAGYTWLTGTTNFDAANTDTSDVALRQKPPVVVHMRANIGVDLYTKGTHLWNV